MHPYTIIAKHAIAKNTNTNIIFLNGVSNSPVYTNSTNLTNPNMQIIAISNDTIEYAISIFIKIPIDELLQFQRHTQGR